MDFFVVKLFHYRLKAVLGHLPMTFFDLQKYEFHNVTNRQTGGQTNGHIV